MDFCDQSTVTGQYGELTGGCAIGMYGLFERCGSRLRCMSILRVHFGGEDQEVHIAGVCFTLVIFVRVFVNY